MNIYNALIYKKLYGGGGGGEIEVESLTATENKTYNAGEGKAYNPVVVAVPEPTLISKNITANGDYSASADNADGYSSVSVNVPLPSNAYLLQSIEHEQVATFSDGTDNYVKSLVVAIEPIQSGSGEPSPSNNRPIYGHQTEIINRRGANMFSGEMELGSIDDTTGEEVPDNTCLRNKALYTINVRGGVPFYGVAPFDYNGIKYYFYDRFGNFISCSGWQSKGVYTPPNDAVIVRIVLSSDYGTTYNNDISINYPSTITTYQSFSGHAYFILLTDGTNPLTVYGGKLDVVNGVLTVDRAYVDLGTLSWFTQGNPNTFQAVISDMLTPSNNIMCSHYPTTPASTSAGNMPDKSIKTYGNSSAKYIIVKDSSYSDVATFKTAMNGVQLVYELATPQTIQLSPTIIKSLQGGNNFFASTGEIEWMQYWGKEVTS